jgi:adenylate kinase family enzyme
METFLTKTMPVIEEYKRQGKVTEVEANQSVDEVYTALREAVMLRDALANARAPRHDTP